MFFDNTSRKSGGENIFQTYFNLHPQFLNSYIYKYICTYIYIHPWKPTCPLKRDYFSREYIFQPLIFRGHVSFQGVYMCVFVYHFSQLVIRSHLFSSHRPKPKTALGLSRLQNFVQKQKIHWMPKKKTQMSKNKKKIHWTPPKKNLPSTSEPTKTSGKNDKEESPSEDHHLERNDPKGDDRPSQWNFPWVENAFP